MLSFRMVYQLPNGKIKAMTYRAPHAQAAAIFGDVRAAGLGAKCLTVQFERRSA